MSTLTIPKTAGLETYSVLRKRVRETIAQGEIRVQDAVERENVRTKWEVGKLIQEHILLNKERADYGAKVIHRLSADFGISNTELKYMRQFARTYPTGPHVDQFSWSEIRILLAVNDDEKRNSIAKQAATEKWSRDTLSSEIKKLKAANQITVSEEPAEELLVPIKGVLNTYRIVMGEAGPWQGKPLIDAGFASYEELPATQAGKLKEGDIVRSVRDAVSEKISKSSRAVSETKGSDDKISTDGTWAAGHKYQLTLAPDLSGVDIFTYRAYVIEVTDGDTIWMVIDLGFSIIKQHLRLRGIDAPEITSREGQAAKEFVERELKKASEIVITTTKSDKYDRYLADVFYTVSDKEYFLNNRLLEAGLAVRF